jgi:hypothetical protein
MFRVNALLFRQAWKGERNLVKTVEMHRIDPFVTGLLLIAGALAAFVIACLKQDPADLSKATASRARTRPRAKGLPKGWSSREKYNVYMKNYMSRRRAAAKSTPSLRVSAPF